MKRLATTIGLGLGITLLAAAPATATPPPDDYPVSEGWTVIDDTEQLPAGSACNTSVTLRTTGHQLILVNGEVWDGNPFQAGDHIASFTPDEKVKITNPANGRSVAKTIDGTVFVRVLANGTDGKARGVGRNLFYGSGIYGVLWTDGVQDFRIYDGNTPQQREEIVKIKGKAVDLCAKVGARPVAGKTAVQ